MPRILRTCLVAIMAIPMHANLTDSQVEIVAKAVREAVRKAT